MSCTRDSTPRADMSASGLSNERPAAMKVDRRIRCDDGEYEAPATPDRFVLRQNVVGRTVITRLEHPSIDRLVRALTKWGWWAREFAVVCVRI